MVEEVTPANEPARNRRPGVFLGEKVDNDRSTRVDTVLVFVRVEDALPLFVSCVVDGCRGNYTSQISGIASVETEETIRSVCISDELKAKTIAKLIGSNYNQ